MLVNIDLYDFFSDNSYVKESENAEGIKLSDEKTTENEKKRPEGIPKTPLFLPLPFEHKMYNLMLHSPGSDNFGFNNLMSPLPCHSFRYPELCSPTSPVAPPLIPSPTHMIDPGFPNRATSNLIHPSKEPVYGEQLEGDNNLIKPSISLLKVSKLPYMSIPRDNCIQNEEKTALFKF